MPLMSAPMRHHLQTPSGRYLWRWAHCMNKDLRSCDIITVDKDMKDKDKSLNICGMWIWSQCVANIPHVITIHSMIPVLCLQRTDCFPELVLSSRLIITYSTFTYIKCVSIGSLCNLANLAMTKSLFWKSQVTLKTWHASNISDVIFP